jgi:uncharacterized SAM-binding protein YcdF (DUF218 family)
MTSDGARRRKRKLHGPRVLLATVVLGVLYLVSLLARVVWQGTHDDRRRADVIIVFGAAQADGRPMDVLRARLRHAVELYQQGYAPYLLFTGGRKKGDRFTEAQASRLYALAHGVPDGAILLENQGRRSWPEIQAAVAVMRRRGLRQAILVSDPYHGYRLLRMAHDLRLPAVFSPTPYTRILSLHERSRFVAREVAAYAVYRTVGY